MKSLLVTSALPYANGAIHIGHLVEYIQTDIWVRYWKLRGRDAIYLCADDTHGTPIMMRARQEGIPPEELIERMRHEHQRDFAGFQIQFDHYYSTHSEENRELSTEIYRTLKRNGHIDERSIEQAYCAQDKIFLPDRYIRGRCPRCGSEDQYGDACEVCSATYNARDLRDPQCAECGMEPTWRPSTHMFFRLGDFADRLKQWVQSGHVQGEMANKLQEWFDVGLQDWDISRDAPYFGFEIPDAPGKYFYVWLDAPVGYMAATLNWCRQHGRDFDTYWRGEDTDVYHFIGKDIVYFHALFWPAMLMGAGFRTPTQLCVHGFLTVNGEKMSKSRGTFINAGTYLQVLDPQYLRYYYATKLNSRVEDLDLNFDDFANRVNADLVNKIANIPSRVLAIVHTSCQGRLGALDDNGRALYTRLRDQCEQIGQWYEAREFGQVTRALSAMASEINTYLQEQKPWELAKGDPARAATVCTGALNAFKVVAVLLQPILPEFARSVGQMLGVPTQSWANLDEVIEDRPVRPYERLVERVDRGKVAAMVAASRESLEQADDGEPPTLTLDALVDCEFRTMRVVGIEPVPESDRLVALTLESGSERRTVVAGLGQGAGREALLGKDLLTLTNLEPKPILGRESHGMILAAQVGDVPVPVVVPGHQTSATAE